MPMEIGSGTVSMLMLSMYNVPVFQLTGSSGVDTNSMVSTFVQLKICVENVLPVRCKTRRANHNTIEKTFNGEIECRTINRTEINAVEVKRSDSTVCERVKSYAGFGPKYVLMPYFGLFMLKTLAIC